MVARAATDYLYWWRYLSPSRCAYCTYITKSILCIALRKHWSSIFNEQPVHHKHKISGSITARIMNGRSSLPIFIITFHFDSNWKVFLLLIDLFHIKWITVFNCEETNAYWLSIRFQLPFAPPPLMHDIYIIYHRPESQESVSCWSVQRRNVRRFMLITFKCEISLYLFSINSFMHLRLSISS